MSDAKSGEWAVAVRDAETGKGFFVHEAMRVTEQEARKAFGLAIRAGEYDLPVRVGDGLDESDTIKITAVRLLRWDYEVIAVDNGDALIDAEGGWKVAQEHSCGAIARFLRDAKQLPYREDSFHPGVPCHPGAWGSPNGCAMHWGLPLDEEHGMCAEGKRGAKLLGLVLIPKWLHAVFHPRRTATHEELQVVKAAAVTELVRRDKADHISDDELNETLGVLEREIARAPKPKGMMNPEGDASREPGKEG